MQQTNYLSHWLLTHHLMPLLTSTAKSNPPGMVRIINLTSDGHTFTVKEGMSLTDHMLQSKNAMTRYGHSKLANILHAAELNKRYGPKSDSAESGEIWVAAVHPGHIHT